MNNENQFLNELNEVKIGKKSTEQKEVINNLNKFYNPREEVINFFTDFTEILSDAKYEAKQNETNEQDLKC